MSTFTSKLQKAKAIKYFRFPLADKIKRTTNKAKLAKLSPKDKKAARLNSFFCGLTICLWFLCIIPFCLFADAVFDKEAELWINLLWGALMLVLIIVWIFLGGFSFILIEKKFPMPPLPELTLAERANCASFLRRFYKVPSEYVVTKCYESSIQILKNKDVLLFIHRGKLRITNNFFYAAKDLGCYELDLSKLTVYNKVVDGKAVTFLESGAFQGKFGYRAKTFLDKQQLGLV